MAEDALPTTVEIVPRVIPTGVEVLDDNRTYVTATLVLLPRPAANGVALAKWPSAVGRLIDQAEGLKLFADRISSGQANSPLPRPLSEVRGLKIERRFAPSDGDQGDAARERLDRLWSHLMDVDDWTLLTEALRESQTASSLKDVETDSSAQPSKPDVFPFMRGDSALLMGLERAREVLRGLQGKQAACQVEGCHVNTRGLELDLTRYSFQHKPWIGLHDPIIRLAQATMSDADPVEESLRQDQRLARERREQEPALRRKLENQSRATENIHAVRSKYLKDTTVAGKANLIRQHSELRATSLSPGQCVGVCGLGRKDNDVDALKEQAKAAHSLGTMQDVDEFGDPIVDPFASLDGARERAVNAVRERYSFIQSMPSLARLFNFVVDVKIALEDLCKGVGIDPSSHEGEFAEQGIIDHFARDGDGIPEPSTLQKVAHYLFLTALVGGMPASVPVWSLAKLRLPRSAGVAGDRGHCWLCTNEELVLQLDSANSAGQPPHDVRSSCAVFQFDGVVDLGIAAPDGRGGHNPRYDMTSLDAISAIESDMQVDRRVENFLRTKGASQPANAQLGVHTRRSAGLVLIDRWRQDQVVSQIATAQWHIKDLENKRAIVLDAEQLTLGYRLDVGLKTGAGRRRWRSLMHRRLRFLPPPGVDGVTDANWIESAIDRLYGIDRKATGTKAEESIERRMRADGATIAAVSRLKKNPQGGGTSNVTAFAEEIVVTWQGDPLGVECIEYDYDGDLCGTARPNDDENVKEEKRVGFQMDSSVIDLEMHFGLDMNGAVYHPPRLQYGWPYHFGLRPVYVGGVTLPIEYAISRYEKNFGSGLALPRCEDKTAGRRFLRHERVEAPLLTVSPSVARNIKVSNTATENVAERDSAGTANFMLLRRPPADPTDARGYADSTFRLLTPPIISLQEAALHGVLDKRPIETFKRKVVVDGNILEATVSRPKDGLQSIDFSGTRGGFPHLDETGKPDDRGPAIFRYGGLGSQPRKVPFYPDPAAEAWVVVARRVGSEDYLPGSVQVPVCPEGVKYPDVAPLALEVRRIDQSRKTPLKTIDDLCQQRRIAGLDTEGNLSTVITENVRVQCLTFALAPGEDFEFEIWCAPSQKKLNEWFDVVENVALLIARDGADRELTDGTIDQVCTNSLVRNLPGLVQMTVTDIDAPNAYCGPGGFLLPGKSLLKLIGGAVEKAMLLRPMPELAAVTRIRAMHAVPVPLVAPTFAPDGLMPVGARVVRLAPATLEVVVNEVNADANSLLALKSDALLAKDARWDELSDDGATGVLFDANIDVDLLATSDIELRATLISPTSPVIDDPRKGRSTDDMVRGLWPRFFEDKDGPVIRFNEKPVPTLDVRVSERLFGFIVAADGRVTLPRQQATLLTLRELPDACLSERAGNTKRYNLLLEQRLSGQAEYLAPQSEAKTSDTPRLQRSSFSNFRDARPAWSLYADAAERTCRVERVHPITDPVARRLDLKIVATSQFAGLYSKADLQKASSLESTPCCVWLPATRRPDRIAARSLVPAFVWSRSVPAANSVGSDPSPKATVVRDCIVRVRVKRPWFTSGEGERLGIVLWPPRLLSVDASSRLEKQLRDDRLPSLGRDDRLIDATWDFSDMDLGLGGPFITRWGGDPIRRGPPPQGMLMPPSAFMDYDPDRLDGPQFEEAVLMPIPRGDDVSDAGGQVTVPAAGPSPSPPKADEDQREYMTVSLLTYEPRFDPEYELWYVDVAIDPKNVPEPFLRLGLVRFQKNARRQLQVSEPITEWVQILPKRTVCVSEDIAAKSPDGQCLRRRINVSVESPADYDPVTFDEACAPDTPIGAPLIRASVLRVETKSNEGVHQSVVLPEGHISDACTRMVPRSSKAGTSWSAAISFSEEPVAEGSTCRYAVFVEEVERLLPATFPNEPIPRNTISGTVESGPRFAAWIELGPAPVEPVRNSKPPLKPALRKPKPKLIKRKQSTSGALP